MNILNKSCIFLIGLILGIIISKSLIVISGIYHKDNLINTKENVLILNDSENTIPDAKFSYYRQRVKDILNKHFFYYHTESIYMIELINSSELKHLNDTVGGTTQTIPFYQKSIITIPARTHNLEHTVLHEAIHSIHHRYESYFNETFKSNWIKDTNYVTSYARTNLYEDVAETGTLYLMKVDTTSYKAKLFKTYFENINK